MAYTIDTSSHEMLQRLRNELYEKVFGVYEIFQNYFGTPFTDLQDVLSEEQIADYINLLCINVSPDMSVEAVHDIVLSELRRRCEEHKCSILVWWPDVTVTNEHNRSIYIKDLYAKIQITMEGKIPYENSGFQLMRTTYTSRQFRRGYVHSHILPFNFDSERERSFAFRNPCLGRGPLVGTVLELKNNYEEALWMLFCRELSLYVTVESLRGVPYIRLETVSQDDTDTPVDYYRYWDFRSYISNYVRNMPGDKRTMLNEFIEYYICNGHLTFSYTEGKYQIGMPFYDFAMDASNCFIKWFNEKQPTDENHRLESWILGQKFLESFTIKDRKMYVSRNSTSVFNGTRYNGIPILKFKGIQRYLLVENDETDNPPEEALVLHKSVLDYIAKCVLLILNYRYKNESTNTTDGREESSSTDYKAVYYI